MLANFCLVFLSKGVDRQEGEDPTLNSCSCNTSAMVSFSSRLLPTSLVLALAATMCEGRCLRHLAQKSKNSTTTSPHMVKPHLANKLRPLSSLGADLDYSYYDPIGPFEMYWSFVGEGADESIELAFTLPSDIFIG